MGRGLGQKKNPTTSSFPREVDPVYLFLEM